MRKGLMNISDAEMKSVETIVQEEMMTPAEILEMLDRTEKGKVRQSIQNCVIVFTRDSVLRHSLCRNEMTGLIDIRGNLPWKRRGSHMTDTDMNNLCMYLEITYGITSDRVISKALDIVSNENSYHPIIEYLEALKWDGVPRIEDALHYLLKADKVPYTAEIMKMHMMAAIVLDFEKKERAKEVQELEEQKESLESGNATMEKVSEKMLSRIDELQEELDTTLAEMESIEEDAEKTRRKAVDAEERWSKISFKINEAQQYTKQYIQEPKKWLPEPRTLEGAKSYQNRVIPKLTQFLNNFLKLYRSFIDLKDKFEQVERKNNILEDKIEYVQEQNKHYKDENVMLREESIDYRRIRKILGDQMVDNAIIRAKDLEKLYTPIQEETSIVAKLKKKQQRIKEEQRNYIPAKRKDREAL